ncbi:MAG: fur1 [Myxococcales bacterium]|nr:fur1 [Myxococcales bacterium]
MSAKRKVSTVAGVDLTATLRAAGLRRTAPRVAVLRRLAELNIPVSHAELVDALERDGVDRVTVWRSLMDFTEVGLVTRADLGDHVWRFSLVRQGEAVHARKHPHLLCIDCNTVVCRPDVKVTLPPGQGEIEVQLKGLCGRCEH